MSNLLDRITLKAAVVLILILGAGAAMLMLGHSVVPNENRDFFNIGLGGWLAWTAMAVKRVLDGSDASDAKNDTIANLSGAVVTAQALPSIEPKP